MSHFEDFEKMFGPAENCEKPDAATITQYENVLPAELLDQWRETGWCSYGKGLLWLTDPKQFDDVLDDWVEIVPEKGTVFLRSAFAHLYMWRDGYVYSLDVQQGSLSQVTKNVARMFTLLCEPDVQEKMLRKSLFDEVLPRLGPPARDECYAFEPALALGGPGTADTVQRVKIREHLAILSQLV